MSALDDLAFDDLFGQQTDCPAGAPGRRLRAGQCNELCLALAIEDGLNRRRIALLTRKHRIEPFGHELLTHTGHHRDIGVERVADHSRIVVCNESVTESAYFRRYHMRLRSPYWWMAERQWRRKSKSVFAWLDWFSAHQEGLGNLA